MTIPPRTKRRSAVAVSCRSLPEAAASWERGRPSRWSPRSFGAVWTIPITPPVRPPGSVPEESFLQLCIRCGECFKACPNNVLHPLGFQQGLEGLWTPQVVADWAGCESSCNACGQVCPTGAIRALPLEEKRVARMGLAIVDPRTCLPYAGREACQLCVDECHSAGYHAIEFIYACIRIELDAMPFLSMVPASSRRSCWRRSALAAACVRRANATPSTSRKNTCLMRLRLSLWLARVKKIA